MKKIFAFFLILSGLFFSNFVSAQVSDDVILANLESLSQEISKTTSGQKPDLSVVDMTSSVRSKIQGIIKNRKCDLILDLLTSDDDLFPVEDFFYRDGISIYVSGVSLFFNDVKDNEMVAVGLAFDNNGRLKDFALEDDPIEPAQFSDEFLALFRVLFGGAYIEPAQFSVEDLEYFLSIRQINDLRDYLKALKSEGTITFYGDISRVTNRNDYYMVFYTRSGDIVAIFSPAPNRRNLINSKFDYISEIKNCGVELFK